MTSVSRRLMNVPRWIPTLAGCVVAAFTATSAQAPANRRELVGIVRDSTGAAIEGATVQIPGATAGTNPRGAFQLWTADIDTVTISIRRLGFSAVSALLTARAGQWDTVVVEMDRTSQSLAAVTVTGSSTRRALGLRDFEARRSVGNGVFVARDEIAARNSIRLSDVLQSKRGVRLVKLRSGKFSLRFAAYSHSRPNCVPDIWVDGVWARELEIDDILANDVEAMELYESFATVPSQFTPRGSGSVLPCGTVVLWTRIPGK
jgi:hypothetical protein